MSTQHPPQPASADQPQPRPEAVQAPSAPTATPAAPESAVESVEPTTAAVVKPTPAARPRPRGAAALIFDDPLSQQSSDDTDRGWGERPSAPDSAADLARFLDEKPPHHL